LTAFFNDYKPVKLLVLVPVNPGLEHSDSDSFHDPRIPRSHSNNNNNNNSNDQSRTNSLMSETSSQPDIRPFYKVSIISKGQ
jgi:hypothetical protein